VAWLTVREAAETLGITEAAVRKRTQRGTLEQKKWPDGRVHVYLDAVADAKQEVSQDAERTRAQAQNTSLVKIANLSAVATAFTAFVSLASLVYVLGLFVLWVTIGTTYTHDLTGAWHAVSLVPRTVVAGLGVQHLIVLPLLLMFIAFLLVLVLERGLLGLRKVVLDYLGEQPTGTPDVSKASAEPTTAAAMLASTLIAFYVGWIVLTYPDQWSGLGYIAWFFGGVYLIISLFVSADFIPWKKLFSVLFPVRLRENGKVSPIYAAKKHRGLP
jgi:hypothetical protein